MSKNKGVKKTLAVFLAALMVMSCWVFTPVSFKAEAINMGTYHVKIIIHATNGFDTQDKKGETLYINYKKTDNNGTTGSTTAFIQEDWFETTWNGAGANRGEYVHTILESDVAWFPTRISVSGQKNNDGLFTTDGSFEIDLIVNGITLGTAKSGTFKGKAHFSASYDVTSSQLPTPSEIIWDQDPSNIVIPNSTVAKSHCKDQYGVNMACTPEWSLESTPIDGLSGTASSDNSSASYTITANNDARMSGQGNNERTVTVKATYNHNGTKSATKTFKVIDPQYQATLYPNDNGVSTPASLLSYYGDKIGNVPNIAREGYTLIGFYPTAQGPFFYDDMPTGDKLTSDYVVTGKSDWYASWRANQYNLTFVYKDESYKDKSETSKVYYTQDITAPIIPTSIDSGDYTYTFAGWSPALPTTMPANNVTYTAQYSVKEHYADLTELIKQIGAAEAKQAEQRYIEGAYTAETVSALENALAAAKNFRESKPLKSQQTAVDTAAETLKTAIANLKVKTFTVLFVDEDGNILKNGYFYVSYGDKVAAPTTPEKEGDHDKHYTFAGYDSADSDDLSALNYVTDDLKFIAKFAAENHSFSTKTVPSTCTTDGVIEYTCSDCGYSYTETNANDTAHHKFVETTVKAATCSDNGIKANVCSVCGVYEKGSIKSIDKTGHSYGDWKVYTPATCAGEGVEVRKCSVCDAEEYRKTAKIAHNFGETTVVPATCTAGGYSYHTCSMCGLIEIFDLTEKTEHNLITTTVDPTCVSIGYTETKCSDCGYNVVEQIPATGEHTWSEWTKTQDATCISKGVEERTCSVCNKTEYRFTDMLTEHDYGEWTVYQEATCTSDRIEQHSCTICGKTELNTVVGTKGHKWDETPTVDIEPSCISVGSQSIHCSACDARKDVTSIPAKGHDITTTHVDASCLVSEKEIDKCSRCDYEKTKELSPALDHNFVAVETVPATCGNAGYTRYECSRNCGVPGYTTYDSAATGDHDWDITYSEPNHGVITVVGKCKTEGCNATFETEVESTHKFENVTIADYTPATCSKEGSIKLNCGVEGCTENHTLTLPVNPDAHKAVTTVVKAPTCTEKGVAVTTCDECHKELARVEIPATGHSFTTKLEEKAATCVADGYVKLQCANCEETTEITLEKNPNAHNFVEKENGHHDATCTTPAYDEFVCANEGCGKTYNNFTGTANEHEWKVSVAQDGTKVTVTRTCKNCGKVETDEIEVFAGHHYGDPVEVSKATCSAEGQITLTCTDKDCDDVITITVAKNPNAHSIKTIVAPATCEAEGKAYSYCTVCKQQIGEAVTIAALGHDYNGEETVNTPATCTTAGSKTVKCTRCDASTEVEIPKLGHSYVEKSRVEPTCTETGYVTYVCENDESHTYNALLDKLGHTYDSDVVTEPTCTEQGYTTHHCATCGENIIDTYTDALGHDWDKGEVVHKGNCAEQTVVLHHCQREDCDATKYEYTGTVGEHVFSEEPFETVKATCEEEGYDLFKCEICGFEKKITTSPALGHNWGYWKITKYPTTDEDGNPVNGMQERECLRCGKKDYQEIIDGKFYLVTFYNHDGTRLLPPAYYAYGTAARTPDFTPTRVADTGYTYTFREWNFTADEINCVTKRMAIIAQYDAHERSYAVTYQNEDGTVLQEISKVKFSQITTAYTAATPTKASDEYYDYTFASWTITCNSDDSTAVATATFTAKLKDSGNTPDSGKPGILTGFFAKLRAFFKMIFDKIFGNIGG